MNHTNPDQIYTYFAGTYDRLVKRMPNWRAWLESVIPYLQGPRVLDVSFGTGYLFTQYAGRFEAYGVDYNAAMIDIARQNLDDAGLQAHLQRGDVMHLPYAPEVFDTIINTMAFNGYPDGGLALREMYRVLKPGGRLLMVDVNDPADGNPVGKAFSRRWETRIDPELDMGALFENAGFDYEDKAVGGFGSVHLYLAVK